MKSSLLNMVLVLFGITLVSSAAVALVYRVTEGPIAIAKGDKKLSAFANVLPKFDNRPADEMQTVEMGGKPMNVYTARMDGDVVGYAIESASPGFAADIKIMIGFDVDGKIVNIEVLAETPGLGAKVADTDNPVKTSIVGRNAADIKLSVRKDGGDVDAITASTISSRAYTSAVAKAYEVFKGIGSGQTVFESDTVSGQTVTESETDGVSGATVTDIDGTSSATQRTLNEEGGNGNE